MIGHHRICLLIGWPIGACLNRRAGILKKMPESFSFECRFVPGIHGRDAPNGRWSVDLWFLPRSQTLQLYKNKYIQYYFNNNYFYLFISSFLNSTIATFGDGDCSWLATLPTVFWLADDASVFWLANWVGLTGTGSSWFDERLDESSAWPSKMENYFFESLAPQVVKIYI